MAEVAGLLAQPGVTLEWITGRMTVIEATHYVPPMTEIEHDAWVRSYFDAVSDLPAPFVSEAFDHVSRTIPRKPTPADIRDRALAMRREARERVAMAEPRSAEAPPPRPASSSPEARAEIMRLREQLAQRCA